MDDWIKLAQDWGYEGAGALIIKKSTNEILFVVTEKDGVFQAEIPGGKPKDIDNGDPKATAIREVKEECNLDLTEDMFVKELHTTGGASGEDSIQFITRPLEDDLLDPEPGPGFARVVWGKLLQNDEGKWAVYTDTFEFILVRKFNTYFMDQHKEEMTNLANCDVQLCVAHVNE